MGKTFKQHTEKLWAGDTVVHLSSYIRISVFIARAWNQRGWWTCRPGRYVDGRRCSSLVHLWICLLSVDIPLRQQTQDWLNSLTRLQFLLLLFSHLLSAPVWHRAQPISVCLHDSHLLIEYLSECQVRLSSDPNGSQIALTSALWTGCHLSVSRSPSRCFSSESSWRRNPPLNRHYLPSFLYFLSQKAVNSSLLYLFE